MTRRGKVVTLVKAQLNNDKLDILKKKYGSIMELREYSNGRTGAFFEGGQFRLVGAKCKKTRKSMVKKPTKCCKCACGKKPCACKNKSRRKSPKKSRTRKTKKSIKSPDRRHSLKKTTKQSGGGETMGLYDAVEHLRQHYYNL